MTKEELSDIPDVALASPVKPGPSKEWLIDSGATKHMMVQKQVFSG